MSPATSATSAARFPDAYAALAEPLRVRLLCLLFEGDACVCHLVEVLGCPQPTVSRHLARLRRDKLVVVRREAGWAWYSLAPARVDAHAKMLESLESASGEGALARDRARLRKLRSCLETGCP